MWQLLAGGLMGFYFVEGLLKNIEKEQYSVPPKVEPIQDLTDEQIKKILLTPKVKAVIDDIIKTQTGVVNAFDPEGYYRDKGNNKQNSFINWDLLKSNYEKESKILQKFNDEWLKDNKSYTLIIEDD